MEQVLKDAYQALQGEYYEWKYGLNADEMAAQITTATKAAIATIEEAYTRKPAHVRPLFIALGETHDRASHIIAGMQVIKGLHDKGYKVSVGLEKPYNRVQTGLAYHQINNGNSERVIEVSRQAAAWEKYSPEFLRVANQIYATSKTPFAEEIRNDMCARHKISLTCNDTAMENYNLSDRLDLNDDLLQRVLHEQNIDVDGQSINARSPLGIYLRNCVMIALAEDHAHTTKPDIYIQICGNTHVAGAHTTPQGCKPYHQSLTSLLNDKGHAAIGIPLLGAGFNSEYMPTEAMNEDVQGVELEGPAFDTEAPEQERAWLQEVMPHIISDFSLEDSLPDSSIRTSQNMTP